jgi:holo-[acyl-carrier protein] synthase
LELGIWSFFVSVLGVGVDLVENARIEHSLERFGERFLKRVFTPGEIEYSRSMKFPARHLAARFAAKEAVSKAFGTGIGKAMGWKDIDVRRKASGEPFVVLEGGAKELAAERNVSKVSITLSHTDHHAMAMIVVEGEP